MNEAIPITSDKTQNGATGRPIHSNRPSIGKKVNALERRADETGLELARLKKRVEALEQSDNVTARLQEVLSSFRSELKAELKAAVAETSRSMEEIIAVRQLDSEKEDPTNWSDVLFSSSAIFLGVALLWSSK